jgi:hypothetical protein
VPVSLVGPAVDDAIGLCRFHVWLVVTRRIPLEVVEKVAGASTAGGFDLGWRYGRPLPSIDDVLLPPRWGRGNDHGRDAVPSAGVRGTSDSHQRRTVN